MKGGEAMFATVGVPTGYRDGNSTGVSWRRDPKGAREYRRGAICRKRTPEGRVERKKTMTTDGVGGESESFWRRPQRREAAHASITHHSIHCPK